MDRYTNHFVSPLLTSHSLAYTNDTDSYISEKVFPVVSVKKDKGQIASYTMDNLREEEALRAPGGGTAEVEHSVSISDHFLLKEYALKEFVALEDMEDADSPIEPKQDSVEQLMDRLWIIKERMLAAQLQATGTMTQNTTLAGTAQWNNGATSDPLGDIKTAIRSVKTNGNKVANTLILAEDVLEELLLHPDVIARFPGAPAITQQMILDHLARIFGRGITNLFIGAAQYNNADEGASDSLTEIWTKTAIVAYIEPKPKRRSRSLGLTYQKRKGRVVDTLTFNSGSHTTWDRKGDFVRVTDKFHQKIVDVNCGYLIDAAIA